MSVPSSSNFIRKREGGRWEQGQKSTRDMALNKRDKRQIFKSLYLHETYIPAVREGHTKRVTFEERPRKAEPQGQVRQLTAQGDGGKGQV